MALSFETYEETIEDVSIKIEGLPFLQCDQCSKIYLSDDSRFAVIKIFERANESGSKVARGSVAWGLPLDFSQVTARLRGSRLCFDGGVACGVGGPNGFTRH